MSRPFRVAARVLLLLGTSCAALEQFPERTVDFKTDLGAADPHYLSLLDQVYAEGGNKELIRNQAIEQYLRIIDLRFDAFRQELARQKVRVDFGMSLVGIGVGAAGALAGESTSQLLSAINAGVSGASESFDKAAFYDQAMPALFAQMIASRNELMVMIRDGMREKYEDYPLASAMRHLQAYEFAGSIPGSVIATSADAKAKNDRAENALGSIFTSQFKDDENTARLEAFLGWDGDTFTNAANVTALNAWMKTEGLDQSIPFLINTGVLAGARAEAVKEVVQ